MISFLFLVDLYTCIVQWRSQPKNLGGAKKWGAQKMWFQANNTILFGKLILKAQNDYIFKKIGRAWPLWPPLAAPMVGVPDSVEQLMRNTVPVHDVIWRLYVKGDCNSVIIAKSSILCNKFNCFYYCQTVVPFISFFSQHAIDRRQWTASTVEFFFVNELFMS